MSLCSRDLPSALPTAVLCRSLGGPSWPPSPQCQSTSSVDNHRCPQTWPVSPGAESPRQGHWAVPRPPTLLSEALHLQLGQRPPSKQPLVGALSMHQAHLPTHLASTADPVVHRGKVVGPSHKGVNGRRERSRWHLGPLVAQGGSELGHWLVQERAAVTRAEGSAWRGVACRAHSHLADTCPLLPVPPSAHRELQPGIKAVQVVLR